MPGDATPALAVPVLKATRQDITASDDRRRITLHVATDLDPATRHRVEFAEPVALTEGTPYLSVTLVFPGQPPLTWAFYVPEPSRFHAIWTSVEPRIGAPGAPAELDGEHVRAE